LFSSFLCQQQRGDRTSSAEKPAVGLLEAAFLSISLNGKRDENKRSFAPIFRPSGSPGILSPRQTASKLVSPQHNSSQKPTVSSDATEPCFTAPSRNSKSTVPSTTPSEIHDNNDHDNDNATIHSEDTGILTMNDRRCIKAQLTLTGAVTIK